MKNLYNVSNTTNNGPMTDRVKSRITRLNSRICLVALMLVMGTGMMWGNKKTDGHATILSGKGSISIDANYWSSAAIKRDGNYGETHKLNEVLNVTYSRGNSQDGEVIFNAVDSTGYTFAGWYSDNKFKTLVEDDYTYTVQDRGLWHSDIDITLYTQFTPNDYTIVYKGNGSTHGSTASTAAKYDANVTFTTNGFYKAKYVVTYDVNGGTCATSVDTAYYPFAGWAKTADGSVVYTDGETTTTAPNLAPSGNGYLYAKWESGTTAVTLPTPSAAPAYDGDGEYSFAGWYVSTDDKQTILGASYTPTSNVTLKAKWTLTKEPGFSGVVEGTSHTLKVGETFNFVFSNTSPESPSSSSDDNFYYVITKTTDPTGNRDGSEHPNDVISISGNTITALNNGVATIKFYQKADAVNNIAAGESATFTFTVNRNVPTFTWNTRDHYYYNETIEDFFESNQSATTITVTSTDAAKNIATIVDGDLVIYNLAGTARVTMTQAENYYWAEHTEYRDITPEKANNHVAFTVNAANKGTFVLEAEEHSVWNEDNGYKMGDAKILMSNAPYSYIIVGFTGIPDKLTFKATCDKIGVGAASSYPVGDNYYFDVYESTVNGNWGDATWSNPNRSTNYSDVGEQNYTVQLHATTRYVKLCYHGTCYGHFRNIQVSELQKFETETTALDFATNQLNHSAVQSFVVEHANAGYQTEITAPAHYQVSLSENSGFANSITYSTNATGLTGGDVIDEFTVYVKYLADAEGTHAGNVVVSNNLRDNISVAVSGETQGKLATHLVYIGKASYSVDTTNIGVANLFEVRDANNALVAGATITLGTSDDSKVAIVGTPNAIDPICSGTVTISASYAGDGVTYAAAEDFEQYITIAKVDDEVSFVNGKTVILKDDEYTLSGWASAISGTAITYTSDNESVFKVEDGKLKAAGKGTATLTATSAGNCIYNAGSKTLKIKVRNADDPCQTLLLDKADKLKINAYSSKVTYTIPEGPQDKLTFKVWKYSGATWNANVYIKNASGTQLKKYTYESGSLSTSEPDDANVTIDLTAAELAGAKTIEIDGSGTLYKYISDLKVSQKAYLTASTGSVTMSTVKACETAEGQFTISYSDLSRIQLSQTDDNFTYEVWDGETKLDGFNNDCGDYGTYTVKFFYTPQSKGDYSNTVTISASGLSQEITLSGTANKPDRTIVWDIPSGNVISATNSLDLTAYSETSCQSPAGDVSYTWSSATEGAVTIDGNHITFNKAATVTVTAHTVSSDSYNDASPVDKVWTVGKVGVEMQTLPTITSTITYGDNSSVVTYANNWQAVSSLNNEVVVPGSIAYVGPANFNAAGETNLSFNFTPNDLTVYDAMPFTVPVTVHQKASNALPSAEAITYGAAISSSTLTNSGETEGTWSWNTENNSAILEAGEHTDLAVHFTPNNSNYAEKDAVVSLTVTPAEPNLTWSVAPTSFGKASEGIVFTAASENSAGAITYSITEGSSIASIHATSGALTITNAGTITVQASIAANGNYSAYSISTTATITGAKIYSGEGGWETADNWSAEPGETPDVIISASAVLTIDEEVTVGSLTIENGGAIAVIANGRLTVLGESESRTAYGDIRVAKDGAIALGESARLEVRHFTLEAKLGSTTTTASSGQVEGADKLNINGDAFFQMSFDPSGQIQYGWYDFVVPFEVEVPNGVYDANGVKLTNGVDYAVMNYSEEKRAANGKCWNKYSGTMYPGVLYTITFEETKTWNTFLFKKKGGAGMNTDNTISATCSAGETQYQGWNGLGNSMLHHTEFNVPDGYKMQIYDLSNKKYVIKEANQVTLAVGTAFFLQVPSAQTLTFLPATHDYGFLAPSRARKELDEFRLSLREEGSEFATDHMWVSASEDATESYVIGHDLVKMGTPNEAKVAQMWATKGGKQLCDVETTLTNTSANTPISFYAPKAGTYEVDIERAPENATLFLTYNNRVIWNLSMSSYVIDLSQGTTEGYGLRLVETQSPKVTTGVDEVLGNEANAARKVMIDNVLYVITPEGAMYEVTGKMIR